MADIRKQLAREEAAFKVKEDAVKAKMAALKLQIDKEADEGKREVLKKQRRELVAKQQAIAVSRARTQAAARKRAKKIRIGKCKPNDPLCGVN
jgi:hypothetical protein